MLCMYTIVHVRDIESWLHNVGSNFMECGY